MTLTGILQRIYESAMHAKSYAPSEPVMAYLEAIQRDTQSIAAITQQRDKAIQVCSVTNLSTGEKSYRVMFGRIFEGYRDTETPERAERLAERIRQWIRMWDAPDSAVAQPADGIEGNR